MRTPRPIEDVIKSMSTLLLAIAKERKRREKWDAKLRSTLAGIATSPSELVVRRALVQMKSSQPSDAITQARLKNIAKARHALAKKRALAKREGR
jgi:hypothetical protein